VDENYPLMKFYSQLDELIKDNKEEKKRIDKMKTKRLGRR